MEHDGQIWIDVMHAAGAGARAQAACNFRVVSNRSGSTFIKELVLAPENGTNLPRFTPGDYLQLDIPVYDEIRFRDFDIPEPFASVWERQHIFDLVARNEQPGKQ